MGLLQASSDDRTSYILPISRPFLILVTFLADRGGGFLWEGRQFGDSANYLDRLRLITFLSRLEGINLIKDIYAIESGRSPP